MHLNNITCASRN